MSELTLANNGRGVFRRELLTTVSVLALIGAVYAPETRAADDDADKPTVWIELGGQLERIDSAQALFSPSFFATASPGVKAPIIDSQRRPAYGFGGEGAITFAPESSDWVFSASVRYGRSNGARHLHHQTVARTPTPSGQVFLTSRVFFGDGQTEFQESHYILDFQAGKDMGLGLFGASSVVKAGVRIAQFNSSSDMALHARPYLHQSANPKYPSKYNLFNIRDREYGAVVHTKRETVGIGPSLSWDASLPLVKSGAHSVLGFDWGLNGAVLFGRQKARVSHNTTGYLYNRLFTSYPFIHTAHPSHPVHHTRSRTVVIPNVGGFAGVSLKFPNAKVALGYRADFFLGAIDNGIDTAKKENVGFYGPFISISVGIGG